jgi:hypothetical protein
LVGFATLPASNPKLRSERLRSFAAIRTHTIMGFLADQSAAIAIAG